MVTTIDLEVGVLFLSSMLSMGMWTLVSGKKMANVGAGDWYRELR